MERETGWALVKVWRLRAGTPQAGRAGGEKSRQGVGISKGTKAGESRTGLERGR